MKINMKAFVVGLTYFLICGCHTPYHSLNFTPSSQTGIEALSKAKRNIYPKQVLENPELYRNESVAWVGIVKDIKTVQLDKGLVARIVLEHHYFDWIEDHGAQPEVFFLSPRGEGEFGIILGPGEFGSDIRVRIPIGSMMVAIGKTMVMGNFMHKELSVLTKHRQFFDKRAYRMDVYDYGREGEPIKNVTGSTFFEKSQK
ncbi:MAG: hypothetical protein PHN75_13145 [Syntrophales bacterium]|nr:hypothetical protein [Syntrophales bacterium]